MLENAVENYLGKRVKKQGCLYIKFVSPTMDSLPDRLIFWPGGKMDLVETKAPGKKPRKKQRIVFTKMFEALGFPVHVLDTYEKVDQYIKSKE